MPYLEPLLTTRGYRMGRSIGFGRDWALDEPFPFFAGAALIHGKAHLAYRLFKTHQDGPADDAVADVEFFDMRDCRNGLDIVVVEAVAGVYFEAHLVG